MTATGNCSTRIRGWFSIRWRRRKAGVNAALDLLFNGQRLARVVEQNARGKSGLTVGEVFDAALPTAKTQDEYAAELARMVETQCVQHLFRVAADPDAQQQVNAEAWREINKLAGEFKPSAGLSDAEYAHRQYLLWQIEKFRTNPKEYQPAKPAKIPDGSPIGCGGPDFARAAGDETPR